MQLSVVTPEGSFYEGEVSSLTAQAWDGSLGILNGHAPLVTELGSGLLVAEGDSQERIVLSGGYLQVLNNKVTVLATFACHSKDVNADQAQKDLEEAEKMHSKTEADTKAKMDAIARAKALIDSTEQ
jgi:F-type H+-transporting ATPase subunit epsilon